MNTSKPRNHLKNEDISQSEYIVKKKLNKIATCLFKMFTQNPKKRLKD